MSYKPQNAGVQLLIELPKWIIKMIRKMFFILSLFVATTSTGQDSAIILSKVVDVPKLDKAAIYDRARLWSIDAFKMVEGSIQAQDKESGLLAFTGTFSTPLMYYRKMKKDSVVIGSNDYRIKLKIQTKDNKYRYEISDIEYNASQLGWYHLTSVTKSPLKYSFTSQQKLDNEWRSIKDGAVNFLNDLMASLYSYILNAKTDW